MADAAYSAVSRSHRNQKLELPAEEAGAMMDGAGTRLDLGDSDDGCSDAETERSFRVVRPVYTQRQFDDKHGGRSVRKPLLERLKNRVKHAACNASSYSAALLQLLPCISIMRDYNIRDSLLSDVIAGITVGVMHIPQGMAYAFLAELPAYMGLYTSFFPPLLYFFFGTSRQISMGTLAIVSLLMGGLVRKNLDLVPQAAAGQSNDSLLVAGNASGSELEFQWSGDPVSEFKVALACAACFCVGCIQLLMGLLRLGFLTRYLSDPLISGFTMGVAVHVFSSQIKYVLGINVPGRSGPFSLPLHYFDLVRNLHKTNLVTLGIAVVAVIILYVTKEFVNPRVRKKIKAPLPIELVIVTLGTVISYALDLNGKYNVKVVGKIPTGIPRPELPHLSVLRPQMAADIVTIAIIAFSVCVSLAKIFGKKYNYEVAPSQELVAYGVCNTIGSMFHCWPAGSSLSRSAVQDSMGGKTQLVALFSSTLLLLVLLFIGKYFETVPNCCLSAIILVAIRGMLEQVKEAPVLWRLSSYDFWTWIVTCFGVVLLAVDYGLIIGLAFSIITIIVRTQSPTSAVLGRIPETDLYKNIHAYDDVEEQQKMKIFRFEGSLYFASAENFRDSLFAKTGVNPQLLLESRDKVAARVAKAEAKEAGGSASDRLAAFRRLSPKEKEAAAAARGFTWSQAPVQHIILDASTWGYMDYVGVRTLHQLIQEFAGISVTVFLANPKCGIRECLQRSDFYEQHKEDMIFVSVHDAVLAAQFEQQRVTGRSSSRQLQELHQLQQGKNDDDAAAQGEQTRTEAKV